MEGVATTHRQTANSSVSTILQGAIVGIYIVHDVHEALWNGSNSGILRTSTAIAEARGVHTKRPLTGGSLTVGVAIGHHDDHGLGLTRSNQVVEDLSSTSEFAPGVLVATGTMQQV